MFFSTWTWSETTDERTFLQRGVGVSQTLGFPVCVLFFFLRGSTLLNINNGTGKPCCLVPLSQFVLTVGVRGLTGKGKRGNPVPGGIGTRW